MLTVVDSLQKSAFFQFTFNKSMAENKNQGFDFPQKKA